MCAVVVCLAAWPAVAAGQTPSPPAPSSPVPAPPAVRFFDAPQGVPRGGAAASTRAHRAWTMEIHGGLVRGSNVTAGVGALPPSGAPFETASGLESPALSSWYFGDGAKWLTGDISNLEPSKKLTPLDTVLTEGAASRTHGASYGGRVAYALSRRLDVEFTVDRSVGDFNVTSTTLTGLQASASTFMSAWSYLLNGLSSSPFVTSQLSGTVHPGSQTFNTVALNLFSRHGRYSPYLTGGAGVVLNRGDVSALLSGNLQYLADNLSKTEIDAVSVGFSEAHVQPVFVVGAGVLADLTAHTGFRLDLRVYVSGNPERTTVSASPSTTGTPTVDDLVSINGYTFQFSGVPGTPSTLSVPVANFQTFSGTGLRKQAGLTVGYYFRF